MGKYYHKPAQLGQDPATVGAPEAGTCALWVAISEPPADVASRSPRPALGNSRGCVGTTPGIVWRRYTHVVHAHVFVQVISALRVAPGKGPLPAAQHSPKPSITEARDSLGVLPPSVFQTLPQVSTSDASYKSECAAVDGYPRCCCSLQIPVAQLACVLLLF
jgi:hypothetical protein